MGRRMQLLDMVVMRPRYIECALTINEIIPWLKEEIQKSEIKTIVVLKEEFANEVGLELIEVDNISFYQDLKFVLLVNGIVLKTGIHNSGKKVFIMKMATYKERIPKYWKKRSRFFKKLMKSGEWGELLRKYSKEKENRKNRKKKREKDEENKKEK